MKYTLGLDLGVNSIGWAYVTNENQITAAGCRIFQEGINKKGAAEISKNADRRACRQLRRQTKRTSQRRDKLIRILKANAMFPQSTKEIEQFISLDPYILRKNGLDQKLSLIEFGRVLFHINKRRGFKSNRKSKGAKDGIVKKATDELSLSISANNKRTIGEYLSSLNPMEERIRDRYTLRDMYEFEFEELWKTQSQFHSQLNDKLKSELRDKTIFYQRPLKSVSSLIGNCSIDSKRRRAAKHSLEFQQFRVLEQVNRLIYRDEQGFERAFYKIEDKGLDPQIIKMRNDLIDQLNKRKEYSFTDIKKLLGIPQELFFNLEKGGEEKGEKTLKGNRTNSALSGIFGKTRYYAMPDEEKKKILNIITFADDEKWLNDYAVKNWGLAEKEIEKLNKIDLESGYANYSKTVIKKLIPFMEQGFSLSDSIERAGYKDIKVDSKVYDILNDIRNPIVKQTLYELLRLMNKIKNTYGVPDLIRVELVRELKASLKARAEIHKDNLNKQRENRKIAEELTKAGFSTTGDAIVRYKLWKECGEICPYTGTKIPFEGLFSSSPSFQIEHIIPYSRCLDDSYMNKTLCRVDENRLKGEKTPFEFYNGTEKYEDIKKRIKRLPYPKQKKFHQIEIDDDFITRQLNDTAYISRLARSVLQRYAPKVEITNGAATSYLRRFWGLNSILEGREEKDAKTRSDHRHHTIDAAIIALTNRTALKNLSLYHKINRAPNAERFPSPWQTFRHDLSNIINKTIVSHSINNRVSGPLHEETMYGDTGLKDNKGVGLYSVRKNIEDLTSNMISQIADQVVRGIIIDRLKAEGINLDARVENKTISAALKKGPLYMKSSKGALIKIKKVRIHKPITNVISLPKRNKTCVEPGKNHHIVLFTYIDTKGEKKQGGQICTLFDAVQRKKEERPIVNRNLGPDKEFMCSLRINDMVLFDSEFPQRDNIDYEKINQNLYRVQKISGDTITFRHHTASDLVDDTKRKFQNSSTFNGIKVTIDRLGGIHRSND
ncbi:MAG: type II CRISPR RNA-guided endonuclease Cas9 [Nitrospirae bacterium]|nr:type II CRISPR RNA-guided endonuclease Cas9 [Nitrospirota bacterium]